jgi:hypothetical protein
VRTESGRVIVRSVIETSEPSITEFFSTMRGTINVAIPYEAQPVGVLRTRRGHTHQLRV